MGQRFGPNFPVYKAQYWDKVDSLDVNGNVQDSNFHCMPAGVPRMGPPLRIVQGPKDVIFLYREKNQHRIIPIDGRPHDPVNSNDQTYLGDSVGHWDGDTLVVDVVGFNEETWLGWPGYFHTNKLHVTERLTRQGNTLRYQATADDPDVLMKPWVMDPRNLNLNTNPTTQIEDPPCVESDSANLVYEGTGIGECHMKRLFALAAFIAALAAGSPSFAHHATQAEFDQNNVKTIVGVMTRVMWVNPHVNWHLEVKNADGTVTDWTIVAAAPGAVSIDRTERT